MPIGEDDFPALLLYARRFVLSRWKLSLIALHRHVVFQRSGSQSPTSKDKEANSQPLNAAAKLLYLIRRQQYET